jgi:3-oxoacyl-[acyl-carrier protein] reductase
MSLSMSEHPFRLHNRTALVVGGGGGVGRGICAELARVGCNIVIADLNPGNADTAMMELQADNRVAITVEGDATLADDVNRMFEEAERAFVAVDIVVFCATPPQFTMAIEDYGWDYHQAMIDAFLKIPFTVSQRALPRMKERGFGRIINITSEVFETAEGYSSAYVAGKGAQIGWTRSMATELAPFGITVNEVAPGFIPIDRHDDLDQSIKDAYLESIPMKRWGTPADVGKACVYFASDEASFVSGQTLIVNGGRTPH